MKIVDLLESAAVTKSFSSQMSIETRTAKNLLFVGEAAKDATTTVKKQYRINIV